MLHLTVFLILLLSFAPSSAYAKRMPAPVVQPVVYNGARYIAPNDDGRRACVQAWNIGTNRMLWSVTVFRNFINPFMEEDVQWVFIKTLRVEDGKLIVIDERNRVFSVDLKTRDVRKMKHVSPEKKQVNKPDAEKSAVLLSSRIPLETFGEQTKRGVSNEHEIPAVSAWERVK